MSRQQTTYPTLTLHRRGGYYQSHCPDVKICVDGLRNHFQLPSRLPETLWLELRTSRSVKTLDAHYLLIHPDLIKLLDLDSWLAGQYSLTVAMNGGFREVTFREFGQWLMNNGVKEGGEFYLRLWR